jgi:hypothetical protein
MSKQPPAGHSPQPASASPSWEEHARWIREHLPEMRFQVNAQVLTIVTIWIEHDEDADKMMRLVDILTKLFGAYNCGPTSTWSESPPHTSFGFWNQALLLNAKRVFPLPEGLQPGPMIFLNSLTAAEWKRLELTYNKRPEELPRRGS